MAIPLGDFRTPGQYIQHLLDKKGWNKRVLAIVMGADETVINKLVNGRRRVDAQTALLLSDLFEIQPDDLLDLQKNYDLAKAKIVARADPGIATKSQAFGGVCPYPK